MYICLWLVLTFAYLYVSPWNTQFSLMTAMYLWINSLSIYLYLSSSGKGSPWDAGPMHDTLNYTAGWDPPLRTYTISSLLSLAPVLSSSCSFANSRKTWGYHCSWAVWSVSEQKPILQLCAWLSSLWTGVRLRVTLLWYKPCCFSNANYFVIMLPGYWSLTHQGHLQPHSKSKAWQLSTQL